jgi:sterol desaturase/sphingolipid hydroxylase (fatty acid hydroxylase superfamily)
MPYSSQCVPLHRREPAASRDPMYDPPGSINSANVRLKTVLRTATLSYVYDFGDYWDHRIMIEKTHSAIR